MGRAIPSSPSTTSTPPPSLPLLAVAVASSIAVLFTLCMTHHRKSATNSPKSQPTSPASSQECIVDSPPAPLKPVQPALVEEDKSEKTMRDAPATASPPKRRKLSASLSMRYFPEGLARIRTGRKERHKAASSADEESVWMKTIILGGRCRVPSSDDEDEVAVAVSTGSKGKRRHYHPRTPRSLPVSRTNSFAVADTPVVDDSRIHVVTML